MNKMASGKNSIIYNPSIRAWCLYDWAISGFQTTMVGAVLPLFFRQVSCFSLAENHIATYLWGYASAIAMLGVAILSLMFGPVSDYSGTKKRFLGLFTSIGIIFTFGIALTGPGDWLLLSILFIIAGMAAAGSEVFYDALLPSISPKNQIDRISSYGYATGYLGGGILLALNISMINLLPQTEIAPGRMVPLLGMQLSFASVALWWGLFAIPLFQNVRETKYHSWLNRKTLMISFQRLQKTFKEIKNYKPVLIFLIAFWLYNDGIGTVIKMATAYGDEIGIGVNDLIGAFLLVQFIGIPCTILFGKISEQIGTKRSIILGLVIYTGISVGGFFMQNAIHFWILAGWVGLVQGGTQALSRSFYAKIIPKDKAAEFFSFFTISGKFAGIAGPAIFALFSQFMHNSRYGILSLVFFFIVGGVLLMKVPEK